MIGKGKSHSALVLFFAAFMLLFFSTHNALFASGTAEDAKTSELLFRQKRVNWRNAPANATFYECYLMKTKTSSSNSDPEIYLLDAYLYSRFLRKDYLIVDDHASKEFSDSVNSGEELLAQEDVIYKCIVLYNSSMFGSPIVSIFEAEPVKADIMIVVSCSSDYLPYGWSDYYSLLFFYIGYEFMFMDEIMHFDPPLAITPEYNAFAYNQNGKVLLLDKWPEPQNIRETDAKSLFESETKWFYDKVIEYLQTHATIKARKRVEPAYFDSWKRDGYELEEIINGGGSNEIYKIVKEIDSNELKKQLTAIHDERKKDPLSYMSERFDSYIEYSYVLSEALENH